MPRLRWILAAAFVVLLMVIAGTAYFFEFRKIGYLKTIIAERSAKLDAMKQSVASYREKIAFYRTQEGIAHLAREQYNLVFPGERVYIVLNASDDIEVNIDFTNP